MRKRLVLVAGAVVFGGLVLATPASACDDVVVISPTPVPVDLSSPGDLGGPRGGGRLPAPGEPAPGEAPPEGLSASFADVGSPGSIGVPMTVEP